MFTNREKQRENVNTIERILKRMKEKEMVNHPSHYGGEDNPYEAIKVIEAWECDFNIGTVLRYLCRCGKKTIGGSEEEMRLEDLKKAKWYLNREIENIEKAKMAQNTLDMLKASIPPEVEINIDNTVKFNSGNPYQE